MLVEVLTLSRPWLEDVIAQRDKINHSMAGSPGGLRRLSRSERFAVAANVGEHTIADALDNAYNNVFKLVEAFITLALSMRLKPEYVVVFHPRIHRSRPENRAGR